MIWRWPSQNSFGVWTVLYRTRCSITQFGVSISVWRLTGDTVNITCNFLCCFILSIPLGFKNMNIYVRQSNTTLKDVNTQGYMFRLKLAIFRPYKEHFRQNINYMRARIASLLLQLCSTDWMSLMRDVKCEIVYKNRYKMLKLFRNRSWV
jgi:hypothetical protein